jgi:hypothetical protein
LFHIWGPIKPEDGSSNVFIKPNPSSIGIKLLLAMMKIDSNTFDDLTWIEKQKVLDIVKPI